MPNQEQFKPMSWRKTAGTFLLRRLDGSQEIIAAGQTFQAVPEEIPLNFRDTIKPVDPQELVSRASPTLEVAGPGYQVRPGKLPGRYNVVNSRGKVQNEKPLSAEEAAAFLESLCG